VTRPQPPDEHYYWLGRITAAAAMLDVQLGMLGHAATTGQSWTEDWEAVAGEPGGAARLCATGVKSMPLDLAATATEVLHEARRLRAERNRFVHAVLVMDPEWTGDSAPWLLKDPKGGELALLDPTAAPLSPPRPTGLGNRPRPPEPSCRREGCAARGATPRNACDDGPSGPTTGSARPAPTTTRPTTEQPTSTGGWWNACLTSSRRAAGGPSPNGSSGTSACGGGHDEPDRRALGHRRRRRGVVPGGIRASAHRLRACIGSDPSSLRP
jgi:hypothetical protein